MIINIKGRRFGQWKVLRDDGKRTASGGVAWLCRCRCGRQKYVWSVALRAGLTLSCGCRTKFKTKHGHGHRTPTYISWAGMLSRCRNPRDSHYPDYGGRGIRVTKRWQGRHGFKHFLADVGLRPAGKTLDRINNNGPYTPRNCKWSTPIEQTRNRRCSIKSVEEELGIA